MGQSRAASFKGSAGRVSLAWRARIFRSLLPFLVTAESSTPADARLTLSDALRALTPRQPGGLAP
jgi:hypothetical protein